MTDRALLQQALDALEYHASQTRPIGGTDAVIGAIRQRLAQPDPEEWKWVPVEPTPEMIVAGWESQGQTKEGRPVWKLTVDKQALYTYYAMIAAAPQKGTL